MDFNKEYQKKIKDLLLNGNYNEMKVNNSIRGGGAKLNSKPMPNFDDCNQPTDRQMAQEFNHIQTSFVPRARKSIRQKPVYDTDTSESEDDSLAGGSFMKSFKKVAIKTGKRVGKDILDDYVDQAKHVLRPDEQGEGFTKTMKKFGQTKIGKTLGRSAEKVAVKGID